MTSKWGSLLTPGSRISAVFEGELRQHLAAEYEEDDELVKHVIDQLRNVETQEKLHAEFVEVFDDGAEDMASWCWNKMQQLSTEPHEEAIDSAPEELLGNEIEDDLELQDEGEEGEVPDEDEYGLGAAEAEAEAAEAAHHATNLQKQQQQASKKTKHQPIKFNLQGPAGDTAPHKSSRTYQQRPEETRANNKAEQPAVRAAAPAAAAAEPAGNQRQQLQRAETAETAKSRVETRNRPATRQELPHRAAAAVKGALEAAVKSTAAAASRPARISDSVTSREQQPVEAAAGRNLQSPGADEGRSRDRDRDREHRDRDTNKASRDAAADAGPVGRLAGSKRSAADAVGRGLFGRAFQQLAGERVTRADRSERTGGRRQELQPPREPKQQLQKQPEREQQQQQPGREQQPSRQGQQGRLSVLQRLGAKEQQEHDEDAGKHKNVFERLGVPADDKPAAAADASSRQQELPQQHQQQADAAGVAPGAAGSAHSKAQRPSVYERLGAGAAVSPAAAGVEPDNHQQQQHEQQQQQPEQPLGKAKAVRLTATPTPAAAAAGLTTAGIKRKADTANGSAAPNAAVAAPPAAKKPAAAAAAPAAGSGAAKPGKATSKAAELAKMRAMIEAKAAEVKRLQQAKQQAEQQEEAGKRSVAVFGVPAIVPESVVRAHFAVCGAIKRLTLMPGRPPHVPGAYIEYDSTRAALQALALTGTVLLPNCPTLTVQIKYDYDQNRIRGQKSFAALQKSAAAVGNRNWVNPTPVVVPDGSTPATAAAAAGEPESPASLGDMGLNG